MAISNLWARLQGRYARSGARLFFRRPFQINTQVPFISFTFDDFPKSALHTGGGILKSFGLKGTYYASFGLMGKQAPTGTIFSREDLEALFEQGHELGSHTFGHCDSWTTETGVFENSIIENQRALSELCPDVPFRTFSYPVSPPRIWTKQKVALHFTCSRGGGQTLNAGTADLNYLYAYFLEKSRDNPAEAKNLIERNRQDRGWLIFATHDISKDPTPYGCTPGYFEDVVRCAVASGARILPVVQAWEALRASS